MKNITISITEELKRDMDSLRDINWSEVTRQMLAEKVKRLKLLKEMDEMLKDSNLTEEDAIKLGRELKKSAQENLKKVRK